MWRGGNGSRSGWKSDGLRKPTGRSGRRFDGVGVWGQRSSRPRCWSNWKAGWGSITLGNSRESAAATAERIIREDLKRLKWREVELLARPKSDPAKLAMAARLRRETTLPMPQIAARMHMGTWKSLNAKLHRWRKANEKP